jgi:hypothetical protein
LPIFWATKPEIWLPIPENMDMLTVVSWGMLLLLLLVAVVVVVVGERWGVGCWKKQP